MNFISIFAESERFFEFKEVKFKKNENVEMVYNYRYLIDNYWITSLFDTINIQLVWSFARRYTY